MFRKKAPQKYTLEIPCKIRINSKDEKNFQTIIEDLFNELKDNDKNLKYYNLYNNVTKEEQSNILHYWLKEELYLRLEEILSLKIGPDYKKITYNIINIKIKKGSLVLTFTILFEFIEIYENINKIINIFLEDFSNYINFNLDQYDVTYQYYVPLDFSTGNTNIPHYNRKYTKYMLFPITLSLSAVLAIIASITTIKTNESDLKNIINEELTKYTNQEKLNYIYYNNCSEKQSYNNHITDSTSLNYQNTKLENRLINIEKIIKRINISVSKNSTNHDIVSNKEPDNQKKCGINIHNNIQITNDSLRILKSNYESKP